ncbi:TPA: hypothetical protein RQJ59_004606 [Vibrio vulnificus]|nr:hypothetical protein [Vibrio vulnificus]
MSSVKELISDIVYILGKTNSSILWFLKNSKRKLFLLIFLGGIITLSIYAFFLKVEEENYYLSQVERAKSFQELVSYTIDYADYCIEFVEQEEKNENYFCKLVKERYIDSGDLFDMVKEEEREIIVAGDNYYLMKMHFMTLYSSFDSEERLVYKLRLLRENGLRSLLYDVIVITYFFIMLALIFFAFVFHFFERK